MSKNHEGYHDPTACEAIKQVCRQQKRKSNKLHLTYKLGEIRGFQEARSCIK